MASPTKNIRESDSSNYISPARGPNKSSKLDSSFNSPVGEWSVYNNVDLIKVKQSDAKKVLFETDDKKKSGYTYIFSCHV